MIKTKEGVSIKNLTEEMNIALDRAEIIFDRYKYDVIVTSTNDGIHMKKSLHYKDQAIDIRIYHIKLHDTIIKIHESLSNILGNNYDVILEADHIHIEYDPK